LTIKSTSHTQPAPSLPPLPPNCRECELGRLAAVNATSSRYILVLLMPVNIQLSKISIALAIRCASRP
jgi:hypothetical protein